MLRSGSATDAFGGTRAARRHELRRRITVVIDELQVLRFSGDDEIANADAIAVGVKAGLDGATAIGKGGRL
jgi:hypothetical protein